MKRQIITILAVVIVDENTGDESTAQASPNVSPLESQEPIGQASPGLRTDEDESYDVLWTDMGGEG